MTNLMICVLAAIVLLILFIWGLIVVSQEEKVVFVFVGVAILAIVAYPAVFLFLSEEKLCCSGKLLRKYELGTVYMLEFEKDLDKDIMVICHRNPKWQSLLKENRYYDFSFEDNEFDKQFSCELRSIREIPADGALGVYLVSPTPKQVYDLAKQNN